MRYDKTNLDNAVLSQALPTTLKFEKYSNLNSLIVFGSDVGPLFLRFECKSYKYPTKYQVQSI